MNAPHFETFNQLLGIERHYYLFVHYNLKKKEDYEYGSDGRLFFHYESIGNQMKKRLAYLEQLLTPMKDRYDQEWKGFSFIFLDPGWTELVRQNTAMLVHDLAQLDKETEKILMAAGHQSIRIVTAFNLVELLDGLGKQTPQAKEKYAQYFTGERQQLRYDAAKIVESAIRIANIGRQVPIFRFDDDVVFRGAALLDASKQQGARDQTQHGILRLCERFQELSIDPTVNYFAFSGAYLDRDTSASLQDTSSAYRKAVKREVLVDGFATRIVQMATLPELKQNEKLNLESEPEIDPEIGLAFLDNLHLYGAPPFRQAISGAGFCLSDGAILDAPPFSNMRLNVMWIDDHLKYSLHHELGHFGFAQGSRQIARDPHAWFSQRRHEKPLTYKDVQWHLEIYMLRLILGCVADGWLRADPLLKGELKNMSGDEYHQLIKKVPHIYARKFMDTMPGGLSGDAQRNEFRNLLWESAKERLQLLLEEWKKAEFDNTFFGLFVLGPGHKRYKEFSKDFIPENFKDGFAKFVADLQNKAYPNLGSGVLDSVDLDKAPLDIAVAVLIEDFIRYFDLVVFWKYFVQAVRFMLNQPEERERFIWLFPPSR